MGIAGRAWYRVALFETPGRMFHFNERLQKTRTLMTVRTEHRFEGAILRSGGVLDDRVTIVGLRRNAATATG
jgi:hypothetical protein